MLLLPAPLNFVLIFLLGFLIYFSFSIKVWTHISILQSWYNELFSFTLFFHLCVHINCSKPFPSNHVPPYISKSHSLLLTYKTSSLYYNSLRISSSPNYQSKPRDSLSLIHITIMYVHTSHALFITQYVTKHPFFIFSLYVYSIKCGLIIWYIALISLTPLFNQM